MSALILSIVGLLSGVCASLGIGGGFVLLVYLTAFQGVLQREAQLVNLIFFLPIAILSVILHFKNKLIEKSVILPCILGGVLGVFVGGYLSSFLSNEWITKLFAGFIMLLGIKFLFEKKKKTVPEDEIINSGDRL